MSHTVPAQTRPITHQEIEDAIAQTEAPPKRTTAGRTADANARTVWTTALTQGLTTTDQKRRMSRALHRRLTADQPMTGPCVECGDFWPLTTLADEDGICPECLDEMAQEFQDARA